MNIIFRRSNGEIVGMPGESSRPMTDADVAPEYDVITDGADGANQNEHYIAGSPPAVTARPAPACTLDKSTITANGLDTATLSGIPTGASVRVTDSNGPTDYTVNDGTMEITADGPGTITIAVTPAFPYKPLTVTVTAS